MKKMIFTLAAMLVMSMTAMAQTTNTTNANDDTNYGVTFDRMSSYLELTTDQVEPFRTAMQQFTVSLESFNQAAADQKGEAWQKVYDRHLLNLKRILTDEQLKKYDGLMQRTLHNKAEAYHQQH